MRFDSIKMKGKDGELILPEFIARATLSNDASFSFAIDPKYEQVLVMYSDLVPQTDAQNLRLRFSDDGGSSYYNTAGDYAFASIIEGTVPAASSSTSAAQIRLNSPQAGNAAGEGWSGWCLIENLGGETGYAIVKYRGVHQDATSGPEANFGAGMLIITQARITNAQFDWSAGNMQSGKIAAYGIVKS